MWQYAENSLISENEQLEPFFGQSHPPPPPQEVNNLTKSQSTLDSENLLAELSPHNQMGAAPTTHIHVENPNFDEKVFWEQLELACADASMRLSTACLVKSHRDFPWQSRSSPLTTHADDSDDDVEIIKNTDHVVKVKNLQWSTGSVQLNSTSSGFIQQPVYDLSYAPEQRNSHGQYSPIQSDSAGGFPFIHNPVCINPNCRGQCNNFSI
ncbi:hypothetical protein ACFX12_011024 [Malus domestica]